MPRSSGAATSTTYSLTVNGTDVVTLNPREVPVFVDGGGVQATSNSTDNRDTALGPSYFEVHLDLPVGAKVTAVAISLSGISEPPGTYVFGSYSPSTKHTVQVFAISPGSSAFRTVTKTGNPLATVASGRRYVLDWDYPSLSTGVAGSDGTFYGATVKYTCTAPCVP